MVLKKKTIIIITLVLLIVAAGYVSTKYGRVLKVNNDKKNQTEETSKNSESQINSTEVAAGFFIDTKIGRENDRTALKQTLRDLIDNKNTTKESRTKAENQFIELVNISEMEMVTEDLIKSQGFEDALVLINNSQANVTVKTKSINSEQVSKIKNVVCRATGLPASKVTVQPRE